MATTEEVLDIARKEIGVAEDPPNSNRVKYNTWFYGRNVMGTAYPWCMAFVQWCFDQAGARLPYITASCDGLLVWYYKNRPQSVQKTPQPGNIVIYTFGHTGIVEAVGNGTITAIEGNTSPSARGSQSNGGMVCRRKRKTSTVTAYIRPDYEEEKKMDNTPSPAHKEGVEWALRQGLLKGNAQGDLMLSQGLTREQFCTMIHRFSVWIEQRFQKID